jgi:hypothetical protein
VFVLPCTSDTSSTPSCPMLAYLAPAAVSATALSSTFSKSDSHKSLSLALHR